MIYPERHYLGSSQGVDRSKVRQTMNGLGSYTFVICFSHDYKDVFMKYASLLLIGFGWSYS